MKIKKIEIKIEDAEKSFNRVSETIQDLKKGKTTKGRTIVSFENLKDFRKFLTPNRIRILKTIKENKPKSVYELAKKLKRDRRHLTEDLLILKDLGFIVLKKEENIRAMVKPILNFDKIAVEILL